MRYPAGKSLLALLVLAACASDDVTAGPAGGSGGGQATGGSGGKSDLRPQCKPRSEHYALDADFPDVEPSTKALPVCDRTCTNDPLSTPDGFDPVSSLPSGACDMEPACSMTANAPCPCGGRGRTNEYECRCTQGRWTCGVSARAGAVCSVDCDAGI